MLWGMEALREARAPPLVEGSFLSALDSGEDKAKRGQLAPPPSSELSQACCPGPAWRAMALSLSPRGRRPVSPVSWRVSPHPLRTGRWGPSLPLQGWRLRAQWEHCHPSLA